MVIYIKEFQRNLNTIVIHNSNTDLGGNSNLLIFNVIVIYYIDLGSNCNSNILIFKVIVIYIYIYIYIYYIALYLTSCLINTCHLGT